eukprot:scaffold20848_cov68-Attheya_sp.AAC.1
MIGLPTKRGQTRRDVKSGHIARKTSFIGAFPDELKKGIAPRAREVFPKYEIKYHVSAPRRPNENPAEGGIRELKKRWYRIMTKKNVPKRLWDFGFDWVCETGNLTANSSRYSKGRTPLEIITGCTPEITEYLDFGFYDWVQFRSNAGLGPIEIGRWLGVSHKVGQMMSYWILPLSGIPVSVVTVQRLTNSEKQTDEWKKRMQVFDDNLEAKWNAFSADISNSLNSVHPSKVVEIEDEDKDFIEEYKRVINDTTLPEVDDIDKQLRQSDPYLMMELGIPRGNDDKLEFTKVTKRAKDDISNPMGKAHDNPLLDSRQYEVQFHNGDTEVLTANIIAENLLSQVDDEGRRQMMLDKIIDHRILESAIPKSKGTYETQRGLTQNVRTTKGWEICVQWKDGSTDWIALKDLKESYPVELAEYAINSKIDDEPAFAWWVPYTMKKRERIISKVKSKYWARTHKYGIRAPKNIKEAKEIDLENGDTLWMDSVRLEMKNVRIAFEEYDGNPEELIGYKEITGHLVFDVKL